MLFLDLFALVVKKICRKKLFPFSRYLLSRIVEKYSLNIRKMRKINNFKEKIFKYNKNII